MFEATIPLFAFFSQAISWSLIIDQSLRLFVIAAQILKIVVYNDCPVTSLCLMTSY